MNNGDFNLTMINAVACALGDLVDEVVFLGGAATALLVDEIAFDDVRATEDVDIVFETAVRRDYYGFSKKLRQRGFAEMAAGEDAPICRWILRHDQIAIKVDVMPTDAAVLGFANEWYPRAFEAAQRIRLPDGPEINLIGRLHFMATKFTAWRSRGNQAIFHKDIEDVIFILENRPSLLDEYKNEADAQLREYLHEQMKALLSHKDLANYLPGMVTPGAEASVLEVMREIAS